MRSVDDELETSMAAVAGYLAAADELMEQLFPDNRFNELGVGGRTRVAIQLAALIQQEVIAGRNT